MNFEILRNKTGIYRHFFGEFPDRVFGKIPAAIPSNLQSQGWYWKKYYNTVAGKGTVTKFINDVRRASDCAA